MKYQVKIRFQGHIVLGRGRCQRLRPGEGSGAGAVRAQGQCPVCSPTEGLTAGPEHHHGPPGHEDDVPPGTDPRGVPHRRAALACILKPGDGDQGGIGTERPIAGAETQAGAAHLRTVQGDGGQGAGGDAVTSGTAS